MNDRPATLRVACIQTDAPCPPANLPALLDDAARQQHADIYILPELCTVPYLAPPETLRACAETTDGPTSGLLRRWSAAHDAAVLAGFVERGKHGLHNSVLLVDAGDIRGVYRKRHLSRYEKQLFLPGTANGLFPLRGIVVGVLVCFDLWFPEITRDLIRRGADLFCVPASFGGPQTARIAPLRALENLTPLALCNRAGREPAGERDVGFRGGSSIYAADGTSLVRAPKHVRAVTGAELVLPQQRGNVLCENFLQEMSCHYPLG